MIEIDYLKGTYVCPFCGHVQAYSYSYGDCCVGLYHGNPSVKVMDKEAGKASLMVRWFTCSNKACGKTCITSYNRQSNAQQDIYPRYSYIHFPDYIPEQLRNDYQEACAIIDASPKAAATLFRRCLQGMIRDFWGINKGNLAKEIAELNGKVPSAQWAAIDALRQIGNIGAHMEGDVNLIVEVTAEEVAVLRKLIELLMDKWYIAKHDEDNVFSEISGIASAMAIQRKKTDKKSET